METESSKEYAFYVKEHKTGTTQPATFCLDQYEYAVSTNQETNSIVWILNACWVDVLWETMYHDI